MKPRAASAQDYTDENIPRFIRTYTYSLRASPRQPRVPAVYDIQFAKSARLARETGRFLYAFQANISLYTWLGDAKKAYSVIRELFLKCRIHVYAAFILAHAERVPV